MRLELSIVNIKDIRFGKKTGIDKGALIIDREELIELLGRDKRFDRVDIDLARPGENCRILQVADVIEPRAKTGRDHAGIPAAGEGRTCVLRGAAVVVIDNRMRGASLASMVPRDHIIDMSGPAADMSLFGKTFNIVLLAKPRDKVSVPEYQAALKMAGLKASAYLARAGEGLKPDDIETYDLPPITEITKGIEGLPKITYIFQILSLQYEPIPGDPVLFGGQAADILPTVLHPNQVLDGAVTSALPGLHVQTYRIQNHPMIRELYKRHGKDLCFTGVIVTIAPNNVIDFERVANLSASLAKWVIGADGAVLTKTGGGAPELAMAKTAQRCEQLGIRTAIAMLHLGADFKDAKYRGSTIFSIPEVDAIVSMGFPFAELVLPPVDRVIGPSDCSADGTPIEGHTLRSLHAVFGSLCQLGSSKLTAVRH